MVEFYTTWQPSAKYKKGLPYPDTCAHGLFGVIFSVYFNNSELWLIWLFLLFL